MDRRSFINYAALGVAAGSLGGLGCAGNSGLATETPQVGHAPAAGPGMSAPDGAQAPAAFAHVQIGAAPPGVDSASSWAEIRAEFDLTSEYIHMTALLMAAHPAPVRRAIETYRRALDQNPAMHLEGGRNALMEQGVREHAARYLGAEPDAIALTDSTTMGLGLIYGGLKLAPGDDVLTTTHEHYSSHESLRYATERAGATLRKVALYEHGEEATAEGVVAALAGAIRPATRVVAVTWVHSSTGVKLPVRAIAEVVAAENARRPEGRQMLLCVDGVHGFGVEDVTMADLGCDVFVAGCHKWLFGPRGTGLVWASERAWQRIVPIIPGFHRAMREAWMQGRPPQSVPGGILNTPGGYHSFEHRWALPEAFGFHLAIGKARVQARTHEHASRLKRGLAEMRHVRLRTPMDPALSSGIVCFDVQGFGPDAVVDALLARRIIASNTPYIVSHVRLTPCIYNSPEDVDATLQAIRALT